MSFCMLRPFILCFLNIQWEAHIDLKYIPSQQIRDGHCQLSVVFSSGCIATPRLQDIFIVISSTLFVCIGMSVCVVTRLRVWVGGSRELIHNQPLKSGVQREPCGGFWGDTATAHSCTDLRWRLQWSSVPSCLCCSITGPPPQPPPQPLCQPLAQHVLDKGLVRAQAVVRCETQGRCAGRTFLEQPAARGSSRTAWSRTADGSIWTHEPWTEVGVGGGEETESEKREQVEDRDT